MIKVFTPDKNGKISFTLEELQKLVEEAHKEGFQEGQKIIEHRYYGYPYYGNWWNTVSTSDGSTTVTLNTNVGEVFNGTISTDDFRWYTSNTAKITCTENEE